MCRLHNLLEISTFINSSFQEVIFLIFIYLAAPGLSWDMQDVLGVACGILIPYWGLNLSPLHWEREFLATGPRGKSQEALFEYLQWLYEGPWGP